MRLTDIFNLVQKPIQRVKEGWARRWPSKEEIRDFYHSEAWKKARYNQLARSSRCAACGASAKDGAKMNVDHIKPLHKYWELRLSPKNLQTLCASCNWGKGHTEKDWRAKPKKRRSKTSRARNTSAWKR
jgi:5-methylcytosine-specific restriction endonuclease McrA